MTEKQIDISLKILIEIYERSMNTTKDKENEVV